MTSLALQRIEGKYEILEKLGEGGMGAVYKVRHRLLEEVRVIKMMRPQLLQEEDLKARFFREARVAIQLRHPSIAQLYDFSLDEDGVASIVMEFIQGITLEALLRHGGPPPLPLALEIAQQTLRALHYLHNKGFVHRDISPDNVMLSEGPDGEPLVKLIDLGIAKTLDGGAAGYLTQTGTFLGKVRYAPPEQFGESGASAMDGRGDIYSFGIVLYELLTGRYPIRGRDPSSLIAGHLFWPPLDFAESDPAGRIPPGVREVALRALAKAPEDRFASAQAMAHALAAFRASSDLGGLDLAALLRPPDTGTLRFQTPPGSTQGRLDQQFGLHTTPSPSQVAEITRAFLSAPRVVPAPELPVGNEREGEVAAVVGEVEERIARGDYKGGELLLYEAEVDFGSLEVFSALHQRLADERRREMAAKAEARRRAEQIAAAVSEIESRLAQGEIGRAGKLLDETMSSFGEDTISGELRSRLRDLRDQAREAELNALLEAARERFEMGDFDGALEAAGQVETLAPGHAVALALREEVGAEIRRREEAARQAEEEARLRAEEERRREEEARRAAALQAAAAGIGELIGADVDAAGERLTDALEAFGEEEVLLALRPRIAEALRQREEEARRREEEARQRELEARRREEEARQAAERATALTAVAREVESLLAAADLDTAGERLTTALATFGEESPLADLRSGLDEALRLREEERQRTEEAARREAAFGAHLDTARGLLGEGSLEDAEVALDAAEDLVFGRTETRTLRDEIAAARQLREEARRREEEDRQREEEEARRQAEEARRREEEAARQRELEARQREEEAARQREQEERLQREAETRQRAEEAQRQAEEARQREEEASRQREEREKEERRLAAEARQREQEARHEAARQAALAEIDARLDADDLEGAATLLPRAVAGFGDDPLLRARWERLGAAQVERRRRAEEARKAAEQAAALSAAQAAAIAAIDGSLAGGRIEEAARLLPGAVATFGGTPELRERWEKLETLRRQAGAEALALKAETLHTGGDAERAARTARQALDLDAGNRKAAELLRKIERQR